MSDIRCLSAPSAEQKHLMELARLTLLLAQKGLSRVPLIELSRVLQVEGVELTTLDLSEQQRAALPYLSRLAYAEICRRLVVDGLND